jgi:hypothetical protein
MAAVELPMRTTDQKLPKKKASSNRITE